MANHELRKWFLLFHSRRAKSTHCDHFWRVCKTAEGGRDAAVLTLYKSRGETESWKRCVWREREHMSNGLSWAMHEGSVPTAALILWLGLSSIATHQLHVLMTKEQRLSCTRGLSQLRRSVPTAALIHGACFLNRRRVDTPAVLGCQDENMEILVHFWAVKMRKCKH